MAKEIKKEDIDDVNGGLMFHLECEYDVLYRDCQDGEVLKYRLPKTYIIMTGEPLVKIDAKNWCETNGKIYVGVEKVKVR